MRSDSPTPAQLPQLRTLWKEAFGDPDEFLDLFFGSAFSPERCRCITLDGTVAAALYWFDVTLDRRKAAYIYAVATGEAFRRRGLCRQLMEQTHLHLTEKGYCAALLVPQSPALSRYYRKLGYMPATTHREFTATAGLDSAPIHPIDAAEYARLRVSMLPPGSVQQPGENMDFLSRFTKFYAGPHLLLAAQSTPDGLFVPELLGDAAMAPAVLSALGAAHGTFRTPGSTKPFAMYLPLVPDAPKPSYFAFAFD